MIEPIMYLAIGFLVSMLFGLMILPLVHNRAVRLTTKRIEAATPLSMAEIQADKDQLRAEFDKEYEHGSGYDDGGRGELSAASA